VLHVAARLLKMLQQNRSRSISLLLNRRSMSRFDRCLLHLLQNAVTVLHSNPVCELLHTSRIAANFLS
jgi:hypothetical protein